MDPYPRNPADPALTQRIVEGELSMLGAGLSTCTNELPSPGDRWCAFSRSEQAGATELWVVNVSWALTHAPVACDEASQNCLRLTTDLWTGSQLWGPSHPYTHRFDGDTLIFHADAPADVREPYEGPVYAWRPGWPVARRISGERGVVCNGHRLSAAVYCIDALDVDIEPDALFSAPVWRSFDLIAGVLDADTAEPLSLVEHISFPTGDSSAFRAQFTRSGDKLAYSSVLEGATHETLRWVALDGPLPFAPQAVLEDAAQWELAHDGAAAYVLRGFSRETRLGTLAVVDFPSGDNVRSIATDVLHLDPVGAFDDLLSDDDHGLGYDRVTPSGEAFELIADRTKLDQIQSVAINVEGPRLSANGAHTTFFQSTGEVWPVAKVARNDGSGSCTLNTALQAETYGARFSPDSQRVLWIEYGRSGSEEGWSADPSTCGQRAKFGDWVLGYSVVGEFVVFEGGDAEDSTSYLNYTRLPRAATSPPVIPLVVEESPGYPFVTLADGDGTYIVYTASKDKPDRHGLFVHGPLEAGLPAP